MKAKGPNWLELERPLNYDLRLHWKVLGWRKWANPLCDRATPAVLHRCLAGGAAECCHHRPCPFSASRLAAAACRQAACLLVSQQAEWQKDSSVYLIGSLPPLLAPCHAAVHLQV